MTSSLAARRDFRVNAMAYDPEKDEIIDPYDGRRDLDERMLRAVGPTGNVYDDAVARFTEDGLRVMRAVRFAAALEFALEGLHLSRRLNKEGDDRGARYSSPEAD